MSASREKKQRQGETGQGLTQRQRKEQQEANAKKHKNILYAILGIVIAILVVALLVWNSGFFQRRTTAATVGDQKFTIQDVDFYYYSALNQQYNVYQQYANYGITPPFDVSKPLSEQLYDEATGKTYQQYFQDTALQNLHRDAAVCAEAKKAGYSLSAEGQKQVDETLAQIDEYAAANNITRGVYLIQAYGKYMTNASFTKSLQNQTLSNEYQLQHQDSLTYSDDQIQTYYTENADSLDSYDFRYFFIDGTAAAPTDAEGNPQLDADGNAIEATDEEKAAALADAKVKAEQAVAEIKANGSTGAAFGAAAPNYVDESSKETYSSNPDYSLQTGTTGTALANYEFATWLTDPARQNGDLSSMESTTNNGYYVLLLENRYLDQTPTVNIRHILIKAETPTDDPATTDVDESSTPTTEQLDVAKSKVGNLLTEWKAGEATAESFATLAAANSDDPGSVSTGGAYTFVEQDSMFPAFNDWIFDPARQTGDTTLIENTQNAQQGWHAIYFDTAEKPIWNKTASDGLRTADQSAWLETLLEPYLATAAPGMSGVGR